ncbi:hypothetical protein JCGZ_22124 [Jatropha curcas]|uniref:B-like cyclin n=1 Tax=Jatropha curcas TaxID=180498 RepID=A0A067LIA8_JATCU|nr:cyclin-D3-1 [Jatropha curcas]KDP47128.1 hypothetical protein JCGZ_22124 [Jatropha curcas]
MEHINTTNPDQSSPFLLETLYCEEERWEEEEQEKEHEEETMNIENRSSASFFPFSILLEQDLFWEDGELLSLFSKEKEQETHINVKNVETNSSLSVARLDAVEWMLKVNAHYAFSVLTAILAVNYLDRFLSSPYFQQDKPWMIQLVAVTCLSLAAKVEETQVPLLLDLQVEDTKYMFEAKTIQRMELLVLSTLKWKMHSVTPLSFLDHIIRRLGLKTNLHWEFFKRCEHLLLTVVSDSRSISYLPSVLATATMMHVIDQVEPLNSIDYQNQLLGVLKMSKEKVKDCYELILEVSKRKSNYNKNGKSYSYSLKRKYNEPIPSSPSGVIGASVFSCDSSNDSWAMGASVSSSAEAPLYKKSRAQDQWVFVDIVGSPH